MSTPTAGPRRLSVPHPDDDSLPRLGKIRLGIKVKSANDRLFPKAVDHFVVNADESTSETNAAAFESVYGTEARTIRCLLVGSTPEENLEGAWRLYGTGKLKRRCNGEECDERLPAGGYSAKPCVCKTRDIPEQIRNAKGDLVANPEHCRLTWTLQLILPDVPGVGAWQLDTSSDISSREVSRFLRMMYRLTGDLTGLLFDLDLKPVQVAPDGRAKTVWVLHPQFVSHTPRQMLEGAGRARPLPVGATSVDPVTGEITNGRRLPALPPPAADDEPDDLLNHDPDDDPENAPVPADPPPNDGAPGTAATPPAPDDDLRALLAPQFRGLADDPVAAKQLFDTIGTRSQKTLTAAYGAAVGDLHLLADTIRGLEARGWTRNDEHKWLNLDVMGVGEPSVSYQEAVARDAQHRLQAAAGFQDDLDAGRTGPDPGPTPDVPAREASPLGSEITHANQAGDDQTPLDGIPAEQPAHRDPTAG